MTAQIICFPQRTEHPIVTELVKAGMRQPSDVMKLPINGLVIEVNGHDFYLRNNCAGFELRVHGEPDPRLILCRQLGAGDNQYSPDEIRAVADLINQISAEETSLE